MPIAISWRMARRWLRSRSAQTQSVAWWRGSLSGGTARRAPRGGEDGAHGGEREWLTARLKGTLEATHNSSARTMKMRAKRARYG